MTLKLEKFKFVNRNIEISKKKLNLIKNKFVKRPSILKKIK